MFVLCAFPDLLHPNAVLRCAVLCCAGFSDWLSDKCISLMLVTSAQYMCYFAKFVSIIVIWATPSGPHVSSSSSLLPMESEAKIAGFTLPSNFGDSICARAMHVQVVHEADPDNTSLCYSFGRYFLPLLS